MTGIDFQTLGERLAAAGLTGRPVDQYSKEEVEVLVQACIDALQPEKIPTFNPPSIDENGTLHIPFDSDPLFHYWRPGGQSIFATLRQLGASEDVFKRYVKVYTGDAPF